MILATGTSGTIGRHLPDSVLGLKIDLASDSRFLDYRQLSLNANLIHLAGIVGDAAVKKNLKLSYKVNVLGTLALAEEFLYNSSGKFCFISSSHVYETSNEPLSENHRTRASSDYSEQKLIAEKYLKEMYSDIPSRLTIVRIFSVLDWDIPDFTLGGAIRKLRNDPNFRLQNGDDVRDFLDPRTIAKALYIIANSESTSGIVNLCSGKGTTVREAATKMLAQSGSKDFRSQISSGISDNPIIVGSNKKIKLAHPELKLDWNPQYSINQSDGV